MYCCPSRTQSRTFAGLLVLALSFTGAAEAGLIPVYSWWSDARGDNFATSDPRWKGASGATKDGYRFVRVEGYIHSPDAAQPQDTRPLYRWWSPSRGDYFTTSNPVWAGRPGQGRSGYQFVRLEGYLSTKTGSNRLPLTSFWSRSREDNFTTTNPNVTGRSSLPPDYRRYRVEGYLEKNNLARFGIADLVGQGAFTHQVATVTLKTPEEAKEESEEKNRDLNTRGAGREIQLYSEPLVDQLEAFGFEDVRGLLNLSTIVYQDQNLDSGVYYYQPKRWSLKWTDEEGYYLNFFSKPSDGSGKNFLVNMTLTDGTTQRDLEILRELLEAYLDRNPSGSAADVKLRPLTADLEPAFNWRLVEEEPEITQLSYEEGEFVLSVSVDSAERQSLVEALANERMGLGGDVYYESDDLGRLGVTANLNLADDLAYGRAAWMRSGETTTEFQNGHPFSVRLNHILYLRSERNRLRLRGYALGGAVVAPGESLPISNREISPQIEDRATVAAWYDYDLAPSDAEMEGVLDALRGGVGSIPETNVRIRVADTEALFEQYGLDLVIVRVRSRFFDPDPERSSLSERSYEFGRGSESVREVATLFAPSDAEEPIYEYRVVVYTAHDEVASEWLAPSSYNPELVFLQAGTIEGLLAE